MNLTQRPLPPWLRYVLPAPMVAAALGLTLIIEPYLEGTVLPPFIAAVAVSALLGGYRSGLAAAVLSLVALKYFFIAPIHSPILNDAPGAARLSLFTLLAALLIWMAGRLKAANERLLDMAATDPLTGLFSRRYLFELLENRIELLARTSGCVSCLVIDIDRFKRVNDTHGHSVGDKVLRGVADVVKRRIRRIDSAARLGGEEFVVVLPATTMEGAMQLAEALRQAIENATHASISVTASIGVATVDCGELRRMDAKALASALLASADRALYAAKDAGRNCVRADFNVRELNEPVTTFAPERARGLSTAAVDERAS